MTQARGRVARPPTWLHSGEEAADMVDPTDSDDSFSAAAADAGDRAHPPPPERHPRLPDLLNRLRLDYAPTHRPLDLLESVAVTEPNMNLIIHLHNAEL